MIQAFSIPQKGKSMEKTGKFRKREKPFTQVSNTLLRDQNISLKAKGLYCLISSYLNMINFTLYKGTLKKSCQEGRDSFDKAWNELKEAGYLIQHKTKANNGRFIYEYELLDEPEVELEKESKKRNSNLVLKEEKNVSDGLGVSQDTSSVDNSTYGFSVYGIPEAGDSVSLNNIKKKNNVKKNSSLSLNNNNNKNVNNSNILTCETENLVVDKKIISQEDISVFFDKNEDKIKDLLSVKEIGEEFCDVCVKLRKLLPKLPKDVINSFTDLSPEQAWSLLMFAWRTYKPDDISKKEYILNPDGYIIGYLRNQLRI